MNIQAYFTNKNILLTGAAGTVGKSFLEALLRTCPNIGKIYVILRSKKDLTVQDRLQKDIIEAPIFDQMRRSNPNFDFFMKQKLIPMNGDVSKDRLGLSDKDYEEVISNGHIFISNAASTSFTMNIVEAIETNTLSVLETFKLAKKAKNLEHFVYISTMGTFRVRPNPEKPLQEIMYDMGFDVEAYIESVRKMTDKNEIQAESDRIAKKHEHCYAFSKTVAEVMLYNHRENFPITILRCPSIGPALFHPSPGYIDVPKAWAGNYLFLSLDKCAAYVAHPQRLIKELPMDIFSNFLIVSIAKFAKSNKTQILHPLCDTKMSHYEGLKVALDYYCNIKPGGLKQAPKLFSNPKEFEEYIKELKSKVTTEAEKKKLESTLKFHSLYYRVNYNSVLIGRNESLSNMMNDEEKKSFPIDFKLTPDYIRLSCWGMDKHYLKLNIGDAPRSKL